MDIFLLPIIFAIKLLSKNAFNYIRRKHGSTTVRQWRSFERLNYRYDKLRCDLRFLLTCKKEKLVPVFAQPKISIKADQKLKNDIARLIIKTEINNKHIAKKNLKAELRKTSDELKGSSSFVLFYAMKYRIRRNVANKKLGWIKKQSDKLSRLRNNDNNSGNFNVNFNNNIDNRVNIGNISSTLVSEDFTNKVVINFSSYILSAQERKVLALSLDHYIPFRSDDKKLQVEFERFYSDVLAHSSTLSFDEKSNLKRIFLNTYHRYSKIKHTSEEKSILGNLVKNPDIVLLKLDKGRGVVIMNRSDYVRKSECVLNGSQFEKLDSDPTKRFQAKVQRTLLSMKNQFDKNTYKNIYPSSSQLDWFLR